jgi:myo-inositol 2-dehydrogenase/D-chiro-inositol 1-dehydrogenase
VVGLGRIGRVHAANLARRGWLAAVVDCFAPVARAAGDEHGVAWSVSLEDVLPGVDGVVIAAPTALHAELAERASAAGVAVFCEKPLGLTVEDAERAAAHVEQVGFQRRFDSDWLALAAAEIGELAMFRCSHRNASPPAAELGDIFVDVAVHDLDAARWLGGEVAELHAWEGAGCACISLRFESGVVGLIDVSRAAGYGFECSAELVGSHATARLLHTPSFELLREGHTTSPLPEDHEQRHGRAYLAEIEHFAALCEAHSREAPPDDRLHRRGASPASGQDAVEALRLALLARRSAATGAPASAVLA